ncbi:tail assembly chaperone [Citrobacter freundii]|uniref:tail assembly chaperone n=1 Tax=Citrobacter freundii TaxID=546 RepID=UPI0023B2071C|nr:tail assembly chaperone [Citrobacter freundii]MDE9693286.1 tail assembly chaperone [Citrobacter freundii]MEB0809019.1 tail assembly chaperone [Citrobacter freundii]
MTTKNELAGLPEPVRTHGFIWDADNARLLAYALKPEYEVTGMWPGNGIDVNDSVASEFTGQPPDGKKIGVGTDGMPAWVDIPLPPNFELLKTEISRLGDIYKSDIYDLNTAYLAAIVSDGPQEVTKQQIVRDQINQRKAQYVADIAAAKEKYPV